MSNNDGARQASVPGTGASEAGFGSVFNDGAGGGTAGGAEFQTNFGGESTAMGDIFKAGNGMADDRKKRLVFLGAAGAALIVCVGAILYLVEEEPVDTAPPMPVATAAPKEVTAPPAVAEETATDDEVATDEVAETAPTSTVVGDTTYAYNEKEGGPVVSATSGATVEVSRKQDFSVLYVAGSAKGGKFRIPNPPPGEVFWREQGQATAHKITVTPPAPLAINFKAPANLAAGGSLSWTANGDVAFYRVEFSADPNFENVTNVLATAKNSIALKEVGAGNYHVRLGAFNSTAGRWEYSKPSAVEVK